MTGNARQNETQVAYHRRRVTELKSVRSPWESVWRSVAEVTEPTRVRLSPLNEGAISRKAILDAKGTTALRTLASGMHSGVTSPARPWFRLGTSDPELRDFAPVKTYLATVEQVMRQTFQGSNIYTAFHTGYGDLGQCGQSCGLLVEDEKSAVRIMQLLTGRYWLARDTTGRATTLYRTFKWSVQRIVERFGKKALDNSSTIRTAWDSGKYDTMYDVWHAVEPRLERDPSKIDKANKPFLSNYWLDETIGQGTELLEESGFDSNPIIAPPWELAGDDHYALSPGQIALGDIRGLQKKVQRQLEGIDKIVRPPMTGPTSMKNNPASLLPGAITYADSDGGRGGFRPAMELNLRLAELTADIRETKQVIDTIFYADLFLMLANMEGIQPRNQFEIAERKEEKLLALGPVLENIYNGQLQPVIDRTYDILNAMGRLPPPPPDIQNQDLKIEYISILAQAQKAVATGAVERGVAFVGNLASVKPDVLDKIDADEATDIYFDYLGVPPSIIVPDDKVAEIRQDRAKKQAMAENAQLAATAAPAVEQGANAAATLAQAATLPAGGSLLQRLGIG